APYFLDSSATSTFLKSVVAHEVAHQWWGNRIANANRRNYWFVESLAEYFSAVYMEYAHGWSSYMDQVEGWRRSILESTLKGSVQNADTMFAGEWGGGRSLSPRTAAIYNKGPYAFHILRETFKGQGPRGNDAADKKFFDFLKQATQELAEKREIVTLDIQRAAEKGLGGIDQNGQPYTVDLSWFFDQWIRGSGLPQLRLDWTSRPAEDGGHVLEGTIYQRVMLGRTDQPLEGRVYRGVVDLKVVAKGGPYLKRLVINGPETPVQLKLPEKPVEVLLNDEGAMLALDTTYGKW
ncbi:MAG TPA: M1 family aminopeptidase, partial [Candidatus Polarisedimenticolaceae bacterium]|nr:M1 family aminopeptidase [Candidatus Polarisedimenticolaceae bacterium]